MVSSTPNIPESSGSYFANNDNSTKTGDPQFFVLSDPAATVEEMENAIWQNIGGHEIISLARRDLLDGINLNYNLISNLKELQREYNPQTILPIEDIIAKYFERFGLKFENFLPSARQLQSQGASSPVELDSEGNIVIYVKNIKDNQEVEVQVLGAEGLFRDTIY